jgi:hypothetical protein
MPSIVTLARGSQPLVREIAPPSPRIVTSESCRFPQSSPPSTIAKPVGVFPKSRPVMTLFAARVSASPAIAVQFGAVPAD